MQFARDALPFIHPLSQPCLNLSRSLPKPEKVQAPQCCSNRQGEKNPEPQSLVVGGRDNEGQFCSRFVPYAVAIARDHVKPIRPRGEVGIEGLAARPRILPAFVLPLQHVAESNSLRKRETQCRIANLDIVGAWSKTKIRLW